MSIEPQYTYRQLTSNDVTLLKELSDLRAVIRTREGEANPKSVLNWSDRHFA